ncbi:MAG: corrinoid protein [Nitrososphaerota archaeon]
MSNLILLNKIAKAVVDLNDKEVKELVEEALKIGVNPIEIIEEGLSKGLKEVGLLYEKGEYYIPHLMIAAEIFKENIEKLKPFLSTKETKSKILGKVLIGTVKGDLHDLGKNLVAIMLSINGFEVIDLGKDVPTELFIEKIKEHNPDVLGLSALMSTTMYEQKNIIKALEDSGLRSKVKVIVGGAPVTKEWAEEIGADGYAENAIEAVKIVKNLLKKND